MKVLYVNTSDTQGGAARAAMRIMQAVENCGVSCRMLVKQQQAVRTDIVPIQQYLPHGLWFRVGDWIAHKWKNKWQHLQWRHYPQQDANYKSDLRSMRIYGALQREKYDVLHLHWINQRFLPLEELQHVHTPIVWTLHDSWSFTGVCHYFLDCEKYQQQCGCCPQLGSKNSHDLSYKVWQEKKRIYRSLDLHIVSPSRWLADCARKSSLFSGFDIRVIPNSIDMNLYRPLPVSEAISIITAAQKQNAAVSRILRAAGEKVEKPFILYGAVNAATDRIKGFSSLLSALQILDKQGYCANLVLFGATETDLPLHLDNINVIFIGYVSNTDMLVALYNLADVMVVPSLTENLSCAIMESLSCGTPVCCFDIGGNGDMVEHRSNGYLAVEKDCMDMANGIRACVSHSLEWGTAAHEAVLGKYTPDIVARQYIALYEEIVHTNRRI